MYVSLSSPGAEFVRVDTIVSSSCGVQCSFECSLSGCCFTRADLTSTGKVWWSALVAKWCAILFASSLGSFALGWEDLPRIF